MKRMIHALLAAAVLVSAMTCTAFAVEEEEFIAADGSVVRHDDKTGDGEFTATYDSATVDKQYVVMVVKGDESTYKNNIINNPSENILYIDQQKAEDTTIEFNILPSSVENSVVVLGGENEPLVLGHIYEYVPPYVLGNVNNDQTTTGEPKLDIDDALLILQHYVQLITLDETQCLAADVDQNGRIDIDDALRVLQYYVQLISYEDMIKPA